MISALADAANREGYWFVQRTIDEWNSGANRFSLPGEKLFGLMQATELVGIGGLNLDPYTGEKSCGRVRHLYIGQVYRHRGYATLLMDAIINSARINFTVLRLYTDNPAAAVFYQSLGFQKTEDYKASHILVL